MGVYINMEMPKSCTVCPFENFGDCYGGEVKAIMDIDDYVSAGKSHPRCPLVPVPPHGRLIDADEFKLYLAKMLIKYAPAFKTDEYAHFAVQLTEAIASDIDEAPTIIPAEEGET